MSLPLTVNQLVVLLDCYRGFNRDRHVGTIEHDLAMLEQRAFISPGSDKDFKWLITTIGTRVVRGMLAEARKE